MACPVLDQRSVARPGHLHNTTSTNYPWSPWNLSSPPRKSPGSLIRSPPTSRNIYSTYITPQRGGISPLLGSGLIRSVSIGPPKRVPLFSPARRPRTRRFAQTSTRVASEGFFSAQFGTVWFVPKSRSLVLDLIRRPGLWTYSLLV